MNNVELIGSIELSPGTSYGFSLGEFNGKSYASITKFIISKNADPKPVGGLTLSTDDFKKMVMLMDTQLETLLAAEETELGIIQLKAGERLRIAVTVFNDKYGVDLRKYVEVGEEYVPTKKGVRIPVEDVDTLMEYLQAMFEKLK